MSGSLTGGIEPFAGADPAEDVPWIFVRAPWQDGWVVVLVAVALTQVTSVSTSRLLRQKIARRSMAVRPLSDLLLGGLAGVGLGIAAVTA